MGNERSDRSLIALWRQVKMLQEEEDDEEEVEEESAIIDAAPVKAVRNRSLICPNFKSS
jgi:hypothetical protein